LRSLHPTTQPLLPVASFIGLTFNAAPHEVKGMNMMACERCLQIGEQTFAYDSNGTVEEAKKYCRECVLAALREDEIEAKLERCECGGRLTYPWNDPAMVAQIFSEGLVFWECENSGAQSEEGADPLRHSFLGMYLAQPESDHGSASEFGDWNG
jgi:hypothetical protein